MVFVLGLQPLRTISLCICRTILAHYFRLLFFLAAVPATSTVPSELSTVLDHIGPSKVETDVKGHTKSSKKLVPQASLLPLPLPPQEMPDVIPR
jgi:hypothetical protein